MRLYIYIKKTVTSATESLTRSHQGTNTRVICLRRHILKCDKLTGRQTDRQIERQTQRQQRSDPQVSATLSSRQKSQTIIYATETREQKFKQDPVCHLPPSSHHIFHLHDKARFYSQVDERFSISILTDVGSSQDKDICHGLKDMEYKMAIRHLQFRIILYRSYNNRLHKCFSSSGRSDQHKNNFYR